MILPYFTKFKCSGCDKWHRLGFKQWVQIRNEQATYIALHWENSDVETAINRGLEKFGGKITLWGKLIIWIHKRR